MLCVRYFVNIWFIFVVVDIYYNPTGRPVFDSYFTQISEPKSDG